MTSWTDGQLGRKKKHETKSARSIGLSFTVCAPHKRVAAAHHRRNSEVKKIYSMAVDGVVSEMHGGERSRRAEGPGNRVCTHYGIFSPERKNVRSASNQQRARSGDEKKIGRRRCRRARSHAPHTSQEVKGRKKKKAEGRRTREERYSPEVGHGHVADLVLTAVDGLDGAHSGRGGHLD